MTPRPYRIIVTGWRNWPKECAQVIRGQLDISAALAPAGAQIVVVHGGCHYGGADLFADWWATATPRASIERYPAEHYMEGVMLTEMVGRGADECLAFPGPGSTLTWECMRRVVNADIPLRMTAWCTAFEDEWRARQ